MKTKYQHLSSKFIQTLLVKTLIQAANSYQEFSVLGRAVGGLVVVITLTGTLGLNYHVNGLLHRLQE